MVSRRPDGQTNKRKCTCQGGSSPWASRAALTTKNCPAKKHSELMLLVSLVLSILRTGPGLIIPSLANSGTEINRKQAPQIHSRISRPYFVFLRDWRRGRVTPWQSNKYTHRLCSTEGLFNDHWSCVGCGDCIVKVCHEQPDGSYCTWQG